MAHNLSVHLKKLDEARYVVVEKQGAGRGSLTRISLTPRGRKAFARYLDAMERLSRQVRG